MGRRRCGPKPAPADCEQSPGQNHRRQGEEEEPFGVKGESKGDPRKEEPCGGLPHGYAAPERGPENQVEHRGRIAEAPGRVTARGAVENVSGGEDEEEEPEDRRAVAVVASKGAIGDEQKADDEEKRHHVRRVHADSE